MHNLAVMNAEGAGGGKPDYAEAAQWFRKAGQLGIRDSQFNLGILYARGLGVPQDLVQSWLWFSLAAQQGDADAAKKRDEVAAKMDVSAARRGRQGPRRRSSLRRPPGRQRSAGAAGRVGPEGRRAASRSDARRPRHPRARRRAHALTRGKAPGRTYSGRSSKVSPFARPL